MYSHSTKEINLPVLPPTLLKALRAPEPAFDIAEPAELVTLVRPSEAFDVAFEAVSFAFEAVSAAVEACRNCDRRSRSFDCRRMALEAGEVTMAAIASGRRHTGRKDLNAQRQRTRKTDGRCCRRVCGHKEVLRVS